MIKRTLICTFLVCAVVTAACRAAAPLLGAATPMVLMTVTAAPPIIPTAAPTSAPAETPQGPPATQPPATQPPVTQPPDTQPQVTLPPMVEPAPTATWVVEVAHPILVIFHKTGCFTGVDDKLFVYQDGRYDLQDRKGLVKSGRIPPGDLEQLKQKLYGPEFAALAPLYQAMGADLCVYQITLPDVEGKERSVTTMDAAPTPPFLEALVEELQQVPEK